jgi:hypothetical protein
MAEHPSRIIVNDGLGLDVQVTHHVVAVPMAHHADAVEINSATKHGHGAAGAKGGSAYF